jgi:hypothetical protein
VATVKSGCSGVSKGVSGCMGLCAGDGVALGVSICAVGEFFLSQEAA